MCCFDLKCFSPCTPGWWAAFQRRSLKPSLVRFLGRGWLQPGEKQDLCMKALAAGVTCFEVCLFPGDRWSAPVSGSDPELLDFFVCLFVLVFAERVFVFVFKIPENAFDGNGPSFLDEGSHCVPTLFSIHKIVSLSCLNPWRSASRCDFPSLSLPLFLHVTLGAHLPGRLILSMSRDTVYAQTIT